ncbi:MAG: 1-acyl-sn-glycerol-3-phosphate acyltransferase [Agathobacter sp.]|nr:1-acyl-sn-glycerol-3-phosphate acyltransferase [Agathobacter sp.]
MIFKKLHELLFPFVKNISKKYIHGELIIENNLSYKGPVIYAVNHTNVSDTPVVFHTLNKQAYILAGTKSQKLIDSIGFNLNGVVWVNRHSAKSRKKSTDKLYKILSSAGSVMWFPEGTWNLSDNLLMLPMRYGIVKMAAKVNVPIVPISIYYAGIKIYSTVGDPITIGINEDAITAITQLRDIMATMKYEQMETCGVYKRCDVDKEDFDALIKASLDEYPTFNREYEEKCVFKH